MTSCDDLDLSNNLESMRRMAYDRSKFLNTCTYEISKYHYNKEELNQFYDELRDVIGKIKSQFLCPLCKISPKKCVVLPCSHFFCQKCLTRHFTKKQLNCPECQENCEGKAIPFFAWDSIFKDMNLFLKEANYFQDSKITSEDPKDAAKILKSMHFVLLQRLKNIETQLMCDFCFNKLKQTHLVNCASEAFTLRPFCQGCDKKYIKFYETEQGKILQEPVGLTKFDDIVFKVYNYLNKTILEYSRSCKKPTRLPNGPYISLWPITKALTGFILVGIICLYYSI